ncbi:MAG: DUF481 domain-containing protein [Deltaproteobacteria bacterium]|nr:DUF481 domain-containing protein [Deltaproteobacteria bacterium]
MKEMRMRRIIQASVVASLVLGGTSSAYAQSTTGDMPKPPDAPKALVEGPKEKDGPKALEAKAEGVTATASAGGLFTTGNSRTTAITGNIAFSDVFDKNELNLLVIGNYAEGAKGTDPDTKLSAANIQARARYDRYLTDRFGPFLMYTHRYDQLQGYDVRANIDPGFKYLVLLEEKYQLGLEIGYDIQHDVRRNKSRLVLDDKGNPTIGPDGQYVIQDKTQTNHGLRLGAAYKHSFNKEVTLQSGLEYLQPLNETERWRMNFNALLAAKLVGGFAVGVGFNLLYDNLPLPGKEKLDTTTTLQLIWSFSNVAKKEEKTCPCEDVKPAEPPPPVVPVAPAPPVAPPINAPPPEPTPAPPPPPADAPPVTTPAPAPAPAPTP